MAYARLAACLRSARSNGQAYSYVACFNRDGTLDTGIDPRPDNVVHAVAVRSDGALTLGGYGRDDENHQAP
jgi:hypothetical protein